MELVTMLDHVGILIGRMPFY